MKHILITFLLAFACSASADVKLIWTVETSRVEPVAFECFHGETLDFEASFKSYGRPLDIAGKSARLYWQTNGMGSAWWSTNATIQTRTEHSSTNYLATATFTGEMDPGAPLVKCFIGFAGENYRAAFALKFRPSPGAIPNELPLPTKSIDFATVTVKNPDAAPFVTSESDPTVHEWAKSENPPVESDPTVASWAKSGQPQPVTTESDPTVPEWAKSENPPAESDPTVPAWAKSANPPAESDPTIASWAKSGQPQPVMTESDPSVASWAKSGQAQPLTSESDPTVAEWARSGQTQPLTSESDPTVADWAKAGQPKPQTSLVSATNYTNKVSNDLHKAVSSEIKNHSPGDYATVSNLALHALQPDDVVDNTTSTAAQKPLSANMGRELQDQITNLKQRGRYLSIWNATNGLATTQATTTPYVFKAGDYFIVGYVAPTNGVNYKPSGFEYTNGVASSAVETETLNRNDTYYFDGTIWTLVQAEQRYVSFSALAGDPHDNVALSSELNGKITNPGEGESGHVLTIGANGSTIIWSAIPQESDPTVPAWAKAENPPAETDPTVPAWAKSENPPAESDPTVAVWAKSGQAQPLTSESDPTVAEWARTGQTQPLTSESDPTVADWAKTGQPKPQTSLAPSTNYTDACCLTLAQTTGQYVDSSCATTRAASIAYTRDATNDLAVALRSEISSRAPGQDWSQYKANHDVDLDGHSVKLGRNDRYILSIDEETNLVFRAGGMNGMVLGFHGTAVTNALLITGFVLTNGIVSIDFAFDSDEFDPGNLDVEEKFIINQGMWGSVDSSRYVLKSRSAVSIQAPTSTVLSAFYRLKYGGITSAVLTVTLSGQVCIMGDFSVNGTNIVSWMHQQERDIPARCLETTSSNAAHIAMSVLTNTTQFSGYKDGSIVGRIVALENGGGGGCGGKVLRLTDNENIPANCYRGALCLEELYTDPSVEIGFQGKSFAYLPSLKKVVIGKLWNSANPISDTAFLRCNVDTLIISNSAYSTFSFKSLYGINKGSLKNLIIPAATSLDKEKLFIWSSLTNVVISDKCTDIAEGFFWRSGDLKTVTFSTNITQLVNNEFSDCTNLESIIGLEGLEYVNNCFNHCDSLNELHFSDRLRRIGNSTFSKSGAERITGLSNVEEIGSSAFEQMPNLKTVDFSPALKMIYPSKNFSFCENLVDVGDLSGCTNLSAVTFWGCSSLTNMILGVGIKELNDRTFYGCSSLRKISDLSGLERLNANNVFIGCTSLSDITFYNKTHTEVEAITNFNYFPNLGTACVFHCSDGDFYRSGSSLLPMP